MRRQSKGYEIDMCNGTLANKILLFALPLMASSLLQLLFNAADVVVVGKFAGKEALAAVLETRPEALLNLYVDEKAPFEAFVGVVDIARLKRGGHFVISTQPSER